MCDLIEELGGGVVSEVEVVQFVVVVLCVLLFGIELYNCDFLIYVVYLLDVLIDLIVVDLLYGFGKDYGNDLDKCLGDDFFVWMCEWFDFVILKLKLSGLMYIFCMWQYVLEIFSFLKMKFMMVNEIIWDWCVLSMGGMMCCFMLVYDNIGFFVVFKVYYFDFDLVCILYDVDMKKVCLCKLFEGSKWLEMGYNLKDVWLVLCLYWQYVECVDYLIQKLLEIIEWMVFVSCLLGGCVFDLFMGSGMIVVVCVWQGCDFVGYEINESYCVIVYECVSVFVVLVCV